MKRIQSYDLLVWSALAIAVLFHAHWGRAAVGGSQDSVNEDIRKLSAKDKGSQTVHDYTVREMQTGSGTIREYLNSSGIVFGVGWTGMRHPDLSVLLGSYFSEYHSAQEARGKRHGKGPRHVQSAHLVVASWGHLRKLHGQAYDPSLIPAGVNTHEIR